MLPSLVRKTLRDFRRAGIGWALGIGAFVAMYLSFYPQMRDPETARASAEAIPEGMRQALGWTDYASGAGYMQAVVFGQFAPLLLIMAAAVFGARGVAGPEEAGELDLYLANPISRRQFVLQRFAAVAAVITGVGLVAWLMALAMNAAADMKVPVGNVSAASLGLLLIGLGFGTLAFTLGAAGLRRAAVLGVTGVIAVAAFLLHTLAGQVESIEPLRWASPFHYYVGADPLREGFHAGYLTVLAAIPVVLIAVGAYAFTRRDVGA